MVSQVIILRGKRYYLHGVYSSRNRVRDIIKWGKKHGSNYYILPFEAWFGTGRKYAIYFNKLQ